MFDDRKMRAAAAAMLAQISVPPLPSQAIQRRLAEAQLPAASRAPRYSFAVVAAVLLAILLVP
ncbi:MAG: hypothetical protein WBE83_09360, partial [Candidatus Cybelea sp.]